MPIPVVIKEDVYLNIIHTILKSRIENVDQLCINQDQSHFCIHHVNEEQHRHHSALSFNILQKEENYLLERWAITYHQPIVTSDSKYMRNLTQFISNLPLSTKCRQDDVYLITTFSNQSDKQCYSYLSNQQSPIEFKSDSHLKAQRFQLDDYITIEVVYDNNIPTSTTFLTPWSQEHDDILHPLSVNTNYKKDMTMVPTIISPPNHHSPFVAVRRLSRLSISAMEDTDQEEETNSSIPIPTSSSRMQYTHHNTHKRSTLAFSTSPIIFNADWLGERRNSLTDNSHHGCFVGSFEESLFSGRMSSMPSKPIMFHCQIGVLGHGSDCKPSLKCPPHWSILFPATFYKLPQQDQDYTPVTPYVGTVDIGDYALNELKKSTSPGYRIPAKGQLQVVVKNPNKTAVKLFLIPYDFTEMPKNTKTFLRQKSYTQGTKILRYAIHVQICRTEKKRIYLYKTMKVVFSNQKMDAREKFDVVCEGPNEPLYIPL